MKARDHSELSRLLGDMVLNWGMLEASLNACLVALRRLHGADKIEAEIPDPLSRRLRYFRKAIQQSDLPEDVKTVAIKCAADIKRLSALRHDCIHGTAALLSDRLDGYEFHIFRPATEISSIRVISEADIQAVSVESRGLILQLAILLGSKIDPTLSETLNEMFRELPWEIVGPVERRQLTRDEIDNINIF